MLDMALKEILADRVLVARSSERSVILKESGVMKVEITDLPQRAVAIKLGKIGSLSGVKDGVWRRTCDYLVVCAIDGQDFAIFIELKKTINEDERGREQLRRSLPILEYLYGICRIHHDMKKRELTLIVRYFLIGMRRSSRFDKQHVKQSSEVGKTSYKDIDVHTFLGSRIGFRLLSGR